MAILAMVWRPVYRFILWFFRSSEHEFFEGKAKDPSASPTENDWSSTFHEAKDESHFDTIVGRAEGSPPRPSPAPAYIIKFSATWCKPCHRILPVFSDLSTQFKNGVFICVDVDTMGSIAKEFEADILPQFTVLKPADANALPDKHSGLKIVDMMRGADAEKLEAMIARSLPRSKRGIAAAIGRKKSD